MFLLQNYKHDKRFFASLDAVIWILRTHDPWMLTNVNSKEIFL